MLQRRAWHAAARALWTRRALHASSAQMLAVHVVKVPSMGDSISEGTLVQIAKKPGESVLADEVVAVLETDKVSVEVLSPVAGTVQELFARLEDDLLVGAPIFSVDDSAAPAGPSAAAATTTAAAASPPAASTQSASAQVAKGPSAPLVDSTRRRQPLIKFLGKRQPLALASRPPLPPPPAAVKAPRPAPQSTSSLPIAPSTGAPIRRPKTLPISPAEIDAVNSGVFFL